MTLVVDCSVALKWVLDEPDSPRARDLVDQERLIAPDFILVECANALSMTAVKGAISPSDATARLRTVQKARLGLTSTRPLTAPAQGLSLMLRHPVYDCLYLALALEQGVRVVTADRRFQTAAESHYPGAVFLL